MILVTGGAGYIGSHCVKELADRGYEVAAIDNLQTGHRAALDSRALFFEGDIRDESFLDGVFSEIKIDGVIHFAANSLVGESMKDPLAYYNNNVYGTQVLLTAMRDAGILKIVFSSTAAVYGEASGEFLSEIDRTEPTNTYGETKLAMEKMMKWCDAAFGLKYVSLRYFNVAGASPLGLIGEDHSPETHLIPIILQVPLGKREYLPVYGDDYETKDGTCIRDYIHVSDLWRISRRLNTFKRGKSDIFNLGSGKGFSVYEVLEAARKITGHPIPAKAVSRREGDPARLVSSYEKAKQILKWRPSLSIEQMISDAWRWHKTHPNGFEVK